MSFLTILDTISRLSSIYIRIAPDLIRYTLTTIYYPFCQQISVFYISRVQAYSQRIYIQQSNWVIFDHFGHYIAIIFNLYSYCTRFNSIHINYYILSIFSTNFSLLYLTSASLFTKNLFIAIKLGHFWPFGHYFQIHLNLYSYCTKFNSIHINYYILSIFSTNFSLLYLTSASLFTKNLYTPIKLGHFWPFWTLFPDYLQFIFVLHQI